MVGNPLSDPNWAPQLADTIERVVGSVRAKTTDKVVRAVGFIAFGILALIAAPVVLVVFAILGTRLLINLVDLLPGIGHARAVWIAYLGIALLLMVAGLAKVREPRAEEAA